MWRLRATSRGVPTTAVYASTAAIMIVSVAMVSSTMPTAFGDAYIQNDQMYIGDDGSLHVVGEIVNEHKIPLSQASVDVTLFDENMKPIMTKKVPSMINIIMPGLMGPFDMILTDSKIDDIQSYKLDLNYKMSSPKNGAIDITESKMSRDSHNNMMITGMVVNRGEITANMISVVATLYDSRGNVAAVSRTHPEPDYLRVQDEAFFLVTVPDKIHTNGADKYTLIAESEEYAAVPEFPMGSAILLITTLGAYIGITRYARRITTTLIPATSPG